MNDQDTVCAHCGVRVIRWASAKAEKGWVWKHATGGRGSLACRKPTPTSRQAWNRAMAALFGR